MPAPDRFSPATRGWFDASFAEPTAAQIGAWEAIGSGRAHARRRPHRLGQDAGGVPRSLDRLLPPPPPEEPKRRCRVLYVSPLKALAVDVERNLRAPLAGIRHAATRLGAAGAGRQRRRCAPATPRPRNGARSPADPPDILITTPESLFLMLTSQARESLRGVETVIVDEVHAVAGTKRGAHLALSLERLDALLDQPAQRIGLSATVRPVDEVARFLGGAARSTSYSRPSARRSTSRWSSRSRTWPSSARCSRRARGVRGQRRAAARRRSGRTSRSASSTWSQAHRSTIVFANSRRLAERLTNRLNEIAYEREYGEPLAEPGAPR